jgi:hypothetical protein
VPRRQRPVRRRPGSAPWTRGTALPLTCLVARADGAHVGALLPIPGCAVLS